MERNIVVSDEVRKMIEESGQDYRISTACRGSVIVPISIKPPKDSDIKIPVGNNTLYVSRVQARYIKKVTMDMMYDDEDLYSCTVFSRY
ncbi:MAG: hypothetical protein PHI62_00960 [Candidatus Methanomethylophilaceae archaeon]|nr:hypothetical protein [Candidatus Methanomethylophilaceae archaeon]